MTPISARNAACTAATIWDLGRHRVRLVCCLPAGHEGEHLASEIREVS